MFVLTRKHQIRRRQREYLDWTGPVIDQCGKANSSLHEHFQIILSEDRKLIGDEMMEAIEAGARQGKAYQSFNINTGKSNLRLGTLMVPSAGSKKAIEADVPEAYFAMGRLYDRGEGVVKSERRAFTMYLRAAELGDDAAQYDLTNMNLNAILT